MCFLIGATGPGVTRSGEALLGSVSDDPYLFRTFVKADMGGRQPYVGTELRYIPASTEVTGLSGQEDLPPPFQWEPGQPGRGVNAAGLAFTVALVVEQAGEAEDAVPFSSLCRQMMAECSSVAEAVAVLLEARKVSPAFTVLLADAAGGIAQVEVGTHGCVLHRQYSKDKPGIVMAVNCFQCNLSEFNTAEAGLSHQGSNNGARLERGWELAELHKGHIDVDVLASILSDHQNRIRDCSQNALIQWWGYSICNHGTCSRIDYDAAQPPWGTVSAEILQPSLRTLHYCYGWPCGEKVEFRDQLFQSRSWGCFVGFSLTRVLDQELEAPAFSCTTIDGSVTEMGELLRTGPETAHSRQ